METKMKISIFIPCIPGHFSNLKNIIFNIFRGTDWPGEIVILLSAARGVPANVIDDFEKEMEKYRDHFTIYLHKEDYHMFTGEACNEILSLCRGDVIVIQAADDLPHFRRIEIIRQYFTNYPEMLCLNHSFWGKCDMSYYGMELLEEYTHIKLKNIAVVESRDISDHLIRRPDDVYGQFLPFKVAAGTIAYRKKVAEETRWSSAPRGQDTIFCKEVLKKYGRSIIIDAPVYYYFK